MSTMQPILRSLPRLPAPNLWQSKFKGSRARGHLRVSVMTEDAADAAVKDMQISDHPQRSIIEIFPGPGQLTRSMVMAGAKKVITVESGETFQESLKALEQNSEGRIQHFAMNPLSDPFDEILLPEHTAIPGLKPQSWDKVHEDVMIVGSIPNSATGERVLHELLTASIQRMGVFRMGRVEMYMFCYKDAVQRLIAAPGMPPRNRVTLLAEAAAEITPLVRPGAAHFHLPYDYQLLRLVPHEKPKIETSVDVMDFCLRSLFTNKSHALNKVIKYERAHAIGSEFLGHPLLGPGAEILLGRLSFDHNIKVKHMTLDQLNEVALKFEQWPLRPTVLYDDMIMYESRRKR
ncbi:Dimethyladenosine transferase 1, mitochondrial [Mortierella polycephala]|uniref:rRNA adenine N(6)-methyltransferase n=1 Tax=Mortierella polycephala TaxID=41804 RepID=A0A9P6U4G8_9FUNG|nr:Dimethyladenosine transferase 1, mitochondrial [Mortierella polycephala]